MNKHSIKGLWSEIKGRVKKEYGAASGDRSTEVKGAVQEKFGQARKGYGEADEKVRRGEPENY